MRSEKGDNIVIEGFAVTAIVGLICIILGISNIKGNIETLHSYHRKRVAKEDILPYGRLIGTGTVTIGASIILLAVFVLLSDLLHNKVFMNVGLVLMGIGTLTGIIISVYAMIKYNKGIF